ncbi:MAG: DUF1579 domain-containing protein [Thermoanaerobaculia bacterium]|nr:DUF1579 domain-containing protein [Thermoanaerobaculia bacterium]
MHVEPTVEHKWLSKLAGVWEYEHEACVEPGQPPATVKGRETVRMLGGLWMIAEGEAEMPGAGVSRTVMTIGFDPAKGRFVGTFIVSVLAYLWPYEGSLDADGKILTLDSEGPSFEGDGTMAKYRDSIELVDDDHRILRSIVLGSDGAWTEFMIAHYRRIK